MNKQCKIVIVAMFKNEAKVLLDMLESCKPYADFYVLQNNGSTDGSDQIAKNFLTDNKLSGVVYEEEWRGFGWNRDQLVQFCQSIDHGCDWILQMDSDELLHVDPDFDWSIFNNFGIHQFHIPVDDNNCLYMRAWMWNARYPWRFNHDLVHETVYCADPEINNNLILQDLPNMKFRHLRFPNGETWADPAKFISQALRLEEDLIKNKTLLTDIYHFWNLGHCYNDAYVSSEFPLGESQQKEFARRTIYYFQEYVNFIHNVRETGVPKFTDEQSYSALITVAYTYNFLNDIESGIATAELAGLFVPRRNDHLWYLANTYFEQKQYQIALEYIDQMLDSTRTNPFPEYGHFIDATLYYDSSSNRLQNFRQTILNKLKEGEKNIMDTMFIQNTNSQKRLFVVDEFYANPDEIRNFALTQVEYNEDLRFYKGMRSVRTYRPEWIKQAFEKIIGQPINHWDEHDFNGVFQIVSSENPQVIHYDLQRWAAIVYLTPNAPIESGTRTHRSRINGARHRNHLGADEALGGMFYDMTRFDVCDSVGNIYNRLIIMDAEAIHSAGLYFGNSMHNGRLTHLFFFD